jgi:hypothetical protein
VPRGADGDGDVRVGVLAVELVGAEGEGTEEARLVKEVGRVAVRRVARDGAEVVEDAVHAPELLVHDGVPEGHGALRDDVLDAQAEVGGHADDEVEGLADARERVDVEQARHDELDRVVRRPLLRVRDQILEVDELARPPARGIRGR